MKPHVMMAFILVIFISSAALAQPQPEPEPEPCGVCDFEPMVITGSIENHQQLQDRMREAEVPVREYVEASIGRIESGSARGLRDFAPWYRHTIAEQNARELQSRMVAEFMQRALTAGLNVFVPGSGAVATAIRNYGTQAYGFVVSQAPSGTTDPAPYLENVAVQIENGQDRLENLVTDMFHDTANQALRDQMTTVRLEYVWEKEWQRAQGDQGAGERTPGPDTRRLLAQLGIVEASTRTYETSRERVLTNLIYDVLCERNRSNPVMTCPADQWYWRTIAHGQALRLIVSNAQPDRMFNLTDQAALDRVCGVEQRLGTGLLGMTQDCRQWYANR